MVCLLPVSGDVSCFGIVFGLLRIKGVSKSSCQGPAPASAARALLRGSPSLPVYTFKLSHSHNPLTAIVTATAASQPPAQFRLEFSLQCPLSPTIALSTCSPHALHIVPLISAASGTLHFVPSCRHRRNVVWSAH